MAEWQEMQLGNLVRLEYGAALRAESRTGRGFPVYGSNGVVGHHDMALVLGPGIIVGRKGSAGAVQWSRGEFVQGFSGLQFVAWCRLYYEVRGPIHVSAGCRA